LVAMDILAVVVVVVKEQLVWLMFVSLIDQLADQNFESPM